MLATDLKVGTIFKLNDHPCVVVKYEHIKVKKCPKALLWEKIATKKGSTQNSLT